MNIIKHLYFSFPIYPFLDVARLSSIKLSSCDVTSCNDLWRYRETFEGQNFREWGGVYMWSRGAI